MIGEGQEGEVYYKNYLDILLLIWKRCFLGKEKKPSGGGINDLQRLPKIGIK